MLSTAWKMFRRFWPLARPDRKLLVLGAALAVLAAACEVTAIWVFGIITDDALTAKNLSAFWTPAAVWLGVAIVAAAATFLGDCRTALAGERFLFRLRNSMFGYMQRLPLDFFDNGRLGDLMTRLTDDVESVEELVASGVVRAVTSVISIVTFAVAAFCIRWDLALAACVLIPLFWLVSRSFTGKVRAAAADERAGNGGIADVVEESLSNQAVVQAYNRQRDQEHRLHEQGLAWLNARMAEAKLSALYGPLVQVVETVCILAVLGMGAWELSAGRITLGGLLSFAAFLGYLYPPIQSLGQFSLTVAEAGAAVDRLDDVLRTAPAVTDHAAEDTGWRCHGRIDFIDVGFRYPRSTRRSVDRLSFGADPGELVLLSGPSGAGKSTVTKLLLRFYDPTAGRIMIDGRDIRQLSLRTLRENVTLLHQESQLFAGTVYDNIAYGRPSATHEEVVNAAHAADAHDFIDALSDGYRTEVGHRGRLLSGGQRQRIAIARALLRDTAILVLDEPTTGLDQQSATRIMAPLRRLMAGRTTILITHDASIAVRPDKVVAIHADDERPNRDPQPTRTMQPEYRHTQAIRHSPVAGPARTGVFPALGPSRFVGRAQVAGQRPGKHAKVVGRAGVIPGPSDPERR